MTDPSLASSGAPPSALKLWTDGTSIFIEIPGRAGPYITKRSYDHRAIVDAFSLLGASRIDYDYQESLPSGYKQPVHVPPASALDTDLRRAQARATMLRLGIKPR